MRPFVFAITAAFSAGCSTPDSVAPDGAAGPFASAPHAERLPRAPSALAAVAQQATVRAMEQLKVLAAKPPGARSDTDPAYLGFRRAVACGAPFWQRGATGSEALLGPVRSRDEAGGAVLLLDSALARADHTAALRQLEQVQQGLRLIAAEIERTGIDVNLAAAALSAAAYDLGALALESTSSVPTGHAAVLADLHGTLDAIEQGAAALSGLAGATDGKEAFDAVMAEVLSLRAKLSAAKSSLDLSDRASFVVKTGRLGVAVRRLAALSGARVRLPYAPRGPLYPAERASRDPADSGEPISALTLPAPRLSPDGKDPYPLELARLGRDLFLDTRLSRGGVRSCASCHIPARAFSDGLVAPKSLDKDTPLLRNTPTLLYTSLHAVQLWDGRTLTAESQALGVIHSGAEMGLSAQELLAAIESNQDYKRRFTSLNSPGINSANVGRALAAFEVRALFAADAPIDRFARGDSSALSADERAGLDVFAGSGRCARCHVPPFFGGSRPRDFAIPVFSVLGVPADPSGHKLDPDRGRGGVTRRSADEGSFKTPTVRNIAQTAPYFHNGKFPTLAGVIDFYNRGGGRGRGLALDNQDPDVRPLKLSAEQIRVLLIFLRTALLDDTPPEALMRRVDESPAEVRRGGGVPGR